MTIVLGIDCGLTNANPTALACVDTERMQLLWYQIIGPVDGTDEPWHVRVMALSKSLDWCLKVHDPSASPVFICYEKPHYRENVQTLSKLAHIGGVVLAVAARYSLPCVPVEPTQAKAALTRNAKASKAEMIVAARTIFGETLVKDVADAVGVALAGQALYHRQLLEVA